MDDLRIGIDARLISGTSGGIEQTIIGLIHGLASLPDSREVYCALCLEGQENWIKPYLASGMETLYAQEVHPDSLLGGARKLARKHARRLSTVRTVRSWLGNLNLPVDHSLRKSDGTIEASRLDLMHFTFQSAFLTQTPSIYQPHDLQHRHFPEFFTRQQIERRDEKYATFCEQASIVAIMSSWGKRDLVEQLGIASQKIAVIPWASVFAAYPVPGAADLELVRKRFGLPETFLLFPAQTWPHKNHVRLFAALGLLSSEMGIRVPVVCSGTTNEHAPKLFSELGKLGLNDQVIFTGFVSPIELRSLYRLSTALVFPSLFEGWGMPILEAFEEGLPVISSDATSLKELTEGAAVLFDPMDAYQMAEAIRDVWTGPELRHRLVRAGKIRASQYSWQMTAEIFRAHYRAITGHLVESRDAMLISNSIAQ